MFCGVYADGAEPIGTDGRGDRLGNEINRKASGAAAAGEPLHTKARLVTFMRYRGRRDLLEALLEDGKVFTQKQADAAIETFMKG